MQGAFRILLLVGFSMAQRSPYAGSPKRSNLLPRYRPDSSDSGLGNRVNIETTTELPSELQGTLEDASLVQRVAEWPEEKQPFWFKNRQAISANRGRPVDGNGQDEPITFQERSDKESLDQRNFPSNWRPTNENPNYYWSPQTQSDLWGQNQNQWDHGRNFDWYKPTNPYQFEKRETTTWKPNKKYTNLNRQETNW